METPEDSDPSETVSVRDIPAEFFTDLKNAIVLEVRQEILKAQRKPFIKLLNDHSKQVIVSIEDIYWITVKDEIVEFHVPGLKEKNLHRHGSLQRIEKKINDPNFIQVNKHTLVNRKHVVGMVAQEHEIVMENSMTIPFTATFYPRLKEVLIID